MNDEQNRHKLFIKYGYPEQAKQLGLFLRDKYTGKEWTNHRPKPKAMPVIIIRCDGTYFYDKGELLYTTTGKPSDFSSVMTHSPTRKIISLNRVKTILAINSDFSTGVLYQCPELS
jgi:hypothetical protein